MTNILSLIKTYLDMPMPGKIFKRPISNFQIFHGGIGTTYFLFVTDIIDSMDYMEQVIKKVMNKFKELFPNPEDISTLSSEKIEFIEFLKEMQHSLHSKITILGPMGSGKTLLYNMLHGESERQIMNFAKSAPFKIDNLSFDIWDFQLRDNFSLLWSKFAGGSDLIILLIDASNYHLNVVDNFLKLKRVEGKFARFLPLINKVDLVSQDVIKRLKTEINIPNLKEISLIDPSAKLTILNYIREALLLKKPLPADFSQMIKKAEYLESESKLTPAILKYKELISICNEYQEFSYIDTFKEKIHLLEKKREKEKELQKELERKKKFSAPKKITFTSKVGVKGLPTAKPLPVAAPKGKPIDKPDLALQKFKVKSDKNNATSPAKSSAEGEYSENEVATNKEFEFPNELQKLITQMGGTLSMTLCEKYIEELINTLQRSLTYEDLRLAAKTFIRKETEE
ncbi:MAG: Rab family GTPase [Promethearchaeota archaeon]